MRLTRINLLEKENRMDILLNKLADFFNTLAEIERKVEVTRQVLIENRNFDVLLCFKRIASKENKMIAIQNLQDFLTKSLKNVTKGEIYLLFYNLDTQRDNYIDWDEFVNFMISKECSFNENSGFEKKFTREIEHSLSRVFEEEIQGLKISEEMKEGILFDRSFDTRGIFDLIRGEGEDTITLDDIHCFVSSILGQITYGRAQRILRRLTRSRTGNLNFEEWQNIMTLNDRFQQTNRDNYFKIEDLAVDDADEADVSLSQDNSYFYVLEKMGKTDSSGSSITLKERFIHHEINRSSFNNTSCQSSEIKNTFIRLDSCSFAKDDYLKHIEDEKEKLFINIKTVSKKDSSVMSAFNSNRTKKKGIAEESFVRKSQVVKIKQNLNNIFQVDERESEHRTTSSEAEERPLVKPITLDANTPSVIERTYGNILKTLKKPSLDKSSQEFDSCYKVFLKEHSSSLLNLDQISEKIKIEAFSSPEHESEAKINVIEETKPLTRTEKANKSGNQPSNELLIDTLIKVESPPTTNYFGNAKSRLDIISQIGEKPKISKRGLKKGGPLGLDFMKRNYSLEVDNLVMKSNRSQMSDIHYQRIAVNQDSKEKNIVPLSKHIELLTNEDRNHLIINLEKFVILKREVKNLREGLSLRFDFTIESLFRVITKGRSSEINFENFFKFMIEAGYKDLDNNTVHQILKSYSLDGKSSLDITKFQMFFMPFSKDLRDSLSKRINNTIKTFVDYTSETREAILAIIDFMLDNIKDIYNIKKSIFAHFSNMYFLSKIKEGAVVTLSEVQKLLRIGGIFATYKEVCGIVREFDLADAGCIRFSDFIDVFTPDVLFV